MLGLGGHELRGHLSVRDVPGKALHDLRGRRDRVSRHHVGVDLAPGQGYGIVAREASPCRDRRAHRASSTMLMAAAVGGQTAAQTPQPLQ